MKRCTRRRKFKVKKLFILLFIVMLCVMAGKVLPSSFTTPFLGNITRHIASEDQLGITDTSGKKLRRKYTLKEFA